MSVRRLITADGFIYFTNSVAGTISRVSRDGGAVQVIGKGEGDSVEVSTPRGNKSYEVVTVAFSAAAAKRRRGKARA